MRRFALLAAACLLVAAVIALADDPPRDCVDGAELDRGYSLCGLEGRP